MARIGLVTVLFNSEKVLEEFFKSLSVQSFKDYHLYLIDNTPSASVVKLIADLKGRYLISEITHIQNASNVGVAKGNNQGIELALAQGCSHTLLLNNDIEFDQPFLLEEMIRCAIEKREALIIPKIYYYDTRKIWMAGGGFRNGRGTVYHVGDGAEDGQRFNTPRYFEYAPTCFMLIANKVFSEIGLMDEAYFVYYDDTDFLFRASRAGYKVFYMPSLNVLHKVSSSTGGEESLFSIYFSTRNRIYFIRKNFAFLETIIPMLYTLITRCIRYVLYNADRRKRMIEAIRDGFRMPVKAE